MRTVAAVALLCFYSTGECFQVSLRTRFTHLSFFVSFVLEVSGDDATETTVTAVAGDIARLPCSTVVNVTGVNVTSVTTWEKDGHEVARGGRTAARDAPTPSTAGQRVSVLQDGSLNIREVTPGDAGAYLCTARLLGTVTWRSRVLLQVASK